MNAKNGMRPVRPGEILREGREPGSLAGRRPRRAARPPSASHPRHAVVIGKAR